MASAEGDGARLEWEVEGGEWTAVVMNADASKGVGILLTAGLHVEALLAIAIGLIVLGVIIGTLAALALVWATRGPRAEVEAVPAAAPAFGAVATPYPVVVEGHLDPRLSRGSLLSPIGRGGR